MKLLLINPNMKDEPLKRKRYGFLPPLNLAIIAALSKNHFDTIKIVDENIEDINFDEEADVVGITAMTPQAPKAYKIATEFKKRGKKIILGGMHPSALPEEALNYADCVCIGEVEAYWDEVVKDLMNNKLKKVYEPSPEYFKKPLTIPQPARELLNMKKYLFPYSLQTTRGCPYDCSFCSVTKFFGQRYRFREIEEIIEEIKLFKQKRVVFLDDNIIAHKRRAKELFRALIPYRIKWGSQGSIDITDDDELLRLAAKSGCISLFVGFESLIKDNLQEIGKKINLTRKFEYAIKKLKSYKISLVGAFIFGFDHDDEGIIKRTVEFAKKVKLEVAQFAILTPLPGTKLFNKLKEEGRIFDFNWRNYDIAHVVFHTKNFKPEILQKKFNWAYKNFYSLSSIFKRIGLFGFLRNRYYKYLLIINLAFRKAFRKEETLI